MSLLQAVDDDGGVVDEVLCWILWKASNNTQASCKHNSRLKGEK